MRKIWSKSSKRRSIATTSKIKNEDDVQHTLATVDSQNNTSSSAIMALTQSDYDTGMTKHAWVNAALGASSSQDVSEASLRLYRVELRGSHLYVFRPPSSLSVRSFRVDPSNQLPKIFPSGDTETTISLATSEQATAVSTSEPDTNVAVLSKMTTRSTTENLMSVDPSSQTIGTLKKDSPSEGEAGNSAVDVSITVPNQLSYLSSKIPHPDLKFDFNTSTFLPSSSIEALLHFFVFADGSEFKQPIRHLTSVFPLLPKFGDILKLMHTVLIAINDGEFEGSTINVDLVERILHLFKHIDENFSGFLLKSDVAPHLLKVVELFSSLDIPESKDLISSFKDDMLAKQQLLLDLIGTVDSAAVTLLSESPFAELSSSDFIEKVNLLDLVAAITSIDLLFFNSWNSSTDKSLLLYSSICENTQGDHFYKKNPLIFNNDTHIHYLSRLLVHHIFIESASATPEYRARILEKWIDLGCLLDKTGNMSSWLGISSVILSQPVLRLTSIWTQVNDDYIKLLKNDWSPVLFELDRRHLANSYESLSFGSPSNPTSESVILSTSKESYHIMAPRGLGKIYSKERVIPYFGDLLVNNIQSTNVTELETIWKKINYSFERWNEYLKNLSNSTEIISYNQDVLRRYDAMGFIFSNESLNQVLYLGVNKDEGKPAPQSYKTETIDSSNLEGPKEDESAQRDLKNILLRLLEANCESINLYSVMEYSLNLEPCLTEDYLKSSVAMQPFKPYHTKNGPNSFSIDSSSSLLVSEGMDVTDSFTENKIKDISTVDRLPTYNVEYYKINARKYDEPYSSTDFGSTDRDEKHAIVIDNELVLRVDDFITELEDGVSPTISADDTEEQTLEDEGLGIDVDDILNSEKFKNFSITDEIEGEDRSNSTVKKKHGSFGLISNSSNTPSVPRLAKYIPRYATIDKLIDLLLIDSKYFDDQHPIDLTEYRFVFMLNYSSFISTKSLLEKLAHRFIHSGNAVISVMKKKYLESKDMFDPTTFQSFPCWDVDEEVKLTDLGEVDYELLLKIQVNILKALFVLINNFFENFCNDLRNKKIMIKLLKLYSNEILQWYNSNKIDKELDKSFESLVNFYKRLKKLFVKKSYRPVEASKFDLFLTHEFKFSNTLHDVPMNRNLPSHKNIHKIEKFLSKFNKLLTVFYKGISPENWFTIFKILENSFEKNLLLNYEIQKQTVPEDYLFITDIFHYLNALHETDSEGTVIKKFPLVFRKLFKLYAKFKSYLLIQLCDKKISLDERLDRMKTMLSMIKISKLKMADSQFVFEGDRDDIPSCIESAITSVVYSRESRSFSSLWLKASVSLNGYVEPMASRTYDDIGSLLPTKIRKSDLLMGQEPLLPCFGWIIQNLIEFNKCPSFHRTTINFNKRYFVFKLIKELTVEDLEGEDTHNDTKEFEFLFKLDESLVSDIKLDFSDNSGRILFKNLVKRQYSINANESRKRNLKNQDTVVEPKPVTQVAKTTTNSSLRRQSLTYKTSSSSRFKISGLFNKSRNFSLNNNYERIVNYHELPDPNSVADNKQKPVMVIRLKEKKIFPVYLLPFCFKIDNDNTNHACLFQASNEFEVKNWLKELNFANRHWFYSQSIIGKNDHTFTTFGVPLELVCLRDNSSTPNFLIRIYEAIEREGLKDVGIYRISTSLSELNSIKQEIDTTGTINFEERGIDTHALTSCVKSYLRELPEALLTDEVIESLYPLKRTHADGEFMKKDAESINNALKKLPSVNYFTLKSLIEHLNVVVKHNEFNKMTCSNLATVIGPALTEASTLDSLFNNFGLMNHILETLIENCDLIFDIDNAREVTTESKQDAGDSNMMDTSKGAKESYD